MKKKMFATNDDFLLEKIIEQISGDENLVHYKNYCEKRLAGLRKEAFSALNIFLKDFVRSSFDERKRFVIAVLENADAYSESLSPATMPTPLNVQIIAPTLDEWGKKERENYLPFYWRAKYFYDYDALEHALAINPAEQKPLLLAIERNITALYYSTHHLPDYYCGNISEDMLLVRKVEEEIRLVEDDEVKNAVTADFLFYSTLIRNYHEWKLSGDKNFAEWGAKNNKQISSNVSSYYYTK